DLARTTRRPARGTLGLSTLDSQLQDDREVVRRHFDDLAEREAARLRLRDDRLEIAHPPRRVARPQGRVEGGVARRGVRSAALVRAVEEEDAAGRKDAR